MSENKVQYGLKNVHFATYTVNAGVITYATPVKIPGGVSLTLNPRGELVEFYADDMLYYSASNNQGYDGTLSIATIPQQFAIDALGEELDETDGVLTEKSSGKGKPFCLLFEFDGDHKATRHVLYSCTANRPNVTGNTKTNTAEPQPSELTFVASPRETDLAVKTKTTATTTDAIYNAWYTSVYEKAGA
ncbi:phage tail protein [Schinkia azotoformans]|uniref:major tail protein n=1 Tax=Schinkia azotoformans TaxID=1454 RepID=UPI002E1BCB99|nr:major tail protein [Schinkia azotoformans]MED4354071.1 phage tail protein [Schinkia azotoformans]